VGHSVSVQIERGVPRIEQAVQKGRSARPQRVKGRGVPLGYVEGSERCENDAGGLFQQPVLRVGWLRVSQVVDSQQTQQRQTLRFNLAPPILFLPIYYHQGMRHG
jgi:hypothetical protein